MMDEVFQFVATCKEYPPRSFPPSFNPANILESTMDCMKQKNFCERAWPRCRLQPGLESPEQPEAHLAVIARERDHETHPPVA